MPGDTLKHDADVLIVGAGPAGLALACALDAAGITPLVLERQSIEPLRAPGEDGRDIALTHRSRRVLASLGVWARLPDAEVSPLREARVVDDGPAPELQIAPVANGDGPLGWLVPNYCIRQAVFGEFERRGLRLECDAQVTGFERGTGQASVVLTDGRRFSAPLVIAADSRFSEVRRMAGIGAQMRDFGHTALIGRIAHVRDHDGIAWECFRHGCTLALLPLNGRQVSAVITVTTDAAAEWSALDDRAYAERVAARSPAGLGAMRVAGPRHCYPLVAVNAHAFAAPRFALVGDAAVGMHPVTAHGYNLGLYGVEVLARELAAARRSGRDSGSMEVLTPYAREHRRVAMPIYHGTNAIVRLFTHDRGPALAARRLVLAASQHLPLFGRLIRSAIRNRLTGSVTG
ncbi:MAG: 5-demethoxyubiquinol-8 5-hydroxylase UbiM [Steroidobacteraceae bacterium]